MALLTIMLEEQGCLGFCDKIGSLEGMDFGRHLSIEGTLTLLTKICEGKNGCVC
jgi:hypothetical protein